MCVFKLIGSSSKKCASCFFIWIFAVTCTFLFAKQALSATDERTNLSYKGNFMSHSQRDSSSSFTDVEKKNRSLLDYVALLVKGFLMGSADVVPGVSGGTMAFITGIYEELLGSIRAVGRPNFINAVLKFRWKEIFSILNWQFLLAIFSGIVVAVLTLAPLLERLLEEYPVLLWSFFFGLVAASVLVVSRRVKKWSIPLWLALAIGTVVAFWIVGLIPTQTPESWWFLMLSGAIAICAMILPGISGSFILVLLSKYEFFVSAVTELDIISLAFAGIGAVIGLVSFAQILSWLFKRYHDLTVALLTGLMVGSLRKIWPWKEVLQTITDRHGDAKPILEKNILPSLTVDGAFNMQLLYAIGLIILGFLLVLVIERAGNASSARSTSA